MLADLSAYYATGSAIRSWNLFSPLFSPVHHTDAAREWAYDRDSHIGQLDKALDAAPAKGWTVVDMKDDWKVVYPMK